MNSKDRVVAAVNLEEPDVTPFFGEMTPYMMEEILGKKMASVSYYYATPEQFEEFRKNKTGKKKDSVADLKRSVSDLLEVCRKIGVDLVIASGSTERLRADTVIWLDEETFQISGQVWRYTPEHNTMFYLRGAMEPVFENPDRFKEWYEAELANIKDPKTWESFEANLDTVMKLYRKSDVGIMGTTGGCVMGAYLSWSFEGFFKALYQNPSLAQNIMEVNISRSIATAERVVERDIDIMWIGDDIAYKNGPMIPPPLFKKMVLPHYKRLFDVIKRKGIPIVFHSDGNTWLILDDLISIGLNGLQAIEAQAGMDIGRLKEVYGECLCFIGNVDCGRSLLYGSPGEVAEETRNVIRKAGNGGGLIIGSSNTLLAETSTENYLAMAKATKKYGKYAQADH